MEQFHLSTPEQLLSLYSVYAQDEYELIKTLHNYIKVFSSLILAIIGGALFLFDKTDDVITTGLGFTISGALAVAISYIGYHAACSNYRRQLESIVKRFKIECLMDLNNPAKFSSDKYLTDESLILKRYQDDFAEFGSRNSKIFVDDKMKKGFMRIIKQFYYLTSVLGILLFGIGMLKLIGYVP